MPDPVKPDDSDEKWERYHGHTRAKHELLQYYLDPWLKILSSTNRKLRIFDCFAGRGDYIDGSAEPIELEYLETNADIPGSPQIILDQAIGKSDIVSEVECVFIEKEQKNADILSDRLPDKNTLPPNIDYDVVVGQFQDVTEEEVSKRGGWNYPTFFFIDPFGYSPLEYDIVTNLSKRDGCEILVNLMAKEVIRWQDVNKHQDALQKPFGTDTWRTDLEEFEADYHEHDEVAYYCERLKQNGPDNTLAYLVTAEDSKAMKYYLVFGTNSTKGLEIMRDAMDRCGPGKFAYAPQRPDLANEQTGISDFHGQELRRNLSEMFEGECLTFNSIVESYVQKEKYSAHRRKDIRTELKKMEQEGIVSVSRRTSKSPRGLSRNDEITFPDKT